MECRDFDRLLDALLDGACSSNEWRRAEAHLAACARCRQLFDALGGRSGSDVLDATAQASLTASILARTSGSPCLAARNRLCDYVDNTLTAFDRGLVEAHLQRCHHCSALAGALARSSAVLPGFAALDPPVSLTTRVLAATSRRQAEPGLREQLAAWLGRAAMRPRFSLSVAYVATLLLMLFLGDPVDAIRRTLDRGGVYAQPVVAAVGEQVAVGVSSARRLGSDAAGAVGALTQRSEDGAAGWNATIAAVRQWLASTLWAPVATAIERVSQWIQDAMDTLVRLVRPEPSKPTPPAAAAPTEPFRNTVRLS